MNYRSSTILLAPAIILVLSITGSLGTAAAQEPKQQPKTESKEKGSALTGCIDEQAGHYVLVDDRDLSPIANLEADGFPTEGFAKHLGHKVTVRGTVSSPGARPTFKVRTVETVSETCGPHQ